jgi:hypothetical protein
MNTKTTRRPRLGLVAGVLAVAIATSSGAYAAGAMITSSNQIKNGVVNTGDIKNGSVRVKDLNKKTVAELEPVIEGWTNASLQGAWSPFPNYTAPGFRLDKTTGTVQLRGAAAFGADDGSMKTVFELPPGYRPATTVTLSVVTTNGFGILSEFGAIDIEADGDVRVYGASDDRFVSFDGVSFTVS